MQVLQPVYFLVELFQFQFFCKITELDFTCRITRQWIIEICLTVFQRDIPRNWVVIWNTSLLHIAQIHFLCFSKFGASTCRTFEYVIDGDIEGCSNVIVVDFLFRKDAYLVFWQCVHQLLILLSLLWKYDSVTLLFLFLLWRFLLSENRISLYLVNANLQTGPALLRHFGLRLLAVIWLRFDSLMQNSTSCMILLIQEPLIVRKKWFLIYYLFEIDSSQLHSESIWISLTLALWWATILELDFGLVGSFICETKGSKVEWITRYFFMLAYFVQVFDVDIPWRFLPLILSGDAFIWADSLRRWHLLCLLQPDDILDDLLIPLEPIDFLVLSLYIFDLFDLFFDLLLFLILGYMLISNFQFLSQSNLVVHWISVTYVEGAERCVVCQPIFLFLSSRQLSCSQCFGQATQLQFLGLLQLLVYHGQFLVYLFAVFIYLLLLFLQICEIFGHILKFISINN